MDKNFNIKDLFNKYIAPLLQLNEKDWKIVKQTNDKKDYIYFNALDRGYFCVKSDEFKEDKTRKIVQEIWQQLISFFSTINKKNISQNLRNIESSIYDVAFLWGIAQWLSGNKKPTLTIYNILKQFSNWSIKTYEGHHVKFGVVIDNDNYFEKQGNGTDIDFVEFLNKDSSALISDGVGNSFVVTNTGLIKNVSEVHFNHDGMWTLTPIDLEKTCNASLRNNVGICLTESGDIYCFKKQQLRIARINGKWVSFSYEKFSKVLKEALGNESYNKKYLYEIYNTCLDVSFAKTGGCLAIYGSNANVKELDNILPDRHDLRNKFPLLEYINERNFFDLPRLLRKEIMGIDGATIISHEGKIKSVGAIIKSVNPQSNGGGRQAAAMMLSNYGVAVKISADGYIQIMSKGKIIQEFK